MLLIGIFHSSNKENEKRVPIHPDHIGLIKAEIRRNLFFEKGYSERFGISDEEFLKKGIGGFLTKNEILKKCDVVLNQKPVAEDLKMMKEGGVLWGWPHCVQQQEITQNAIDKKLTLIAFEAMHEWNSDGSRKRHIFGKNNEMAGYTGVIHSMGLTGIDGGNYGRKKKAIVTGSGDVSRGAILALQARGVEDITVFTRSLQKDVKNKISGVEYHQRKFDEELDCQVSIDEKGEKRPLIDIIAESDIVVNGILQDMNNPIMFVKEEEIKRLKSGSLIIDVSCDEGTGFTNAKPTSFEDPCFKIGNATYYAVDHTPTYLWQDASFENSQEIIQYLEVVMGGEAKWKENETIKRSLEIIGGNIQNLKVLSFQNRESEYPYRIKGL